MSGGGALSRREFLQASAGSLLLAQLAACGTRTDAGHPNVLFVLSDAHRACDLGCYGNAEVRTSAFDALATQGARLLTAISCTPQCRPYRASLMSGRHGHRTGVKSNMLPTIPDEDGRVSAANTGMTKLGQWLPGDSPLLGACFRDAGYRCGYVGKWDLGNVAKPGPQRFGFDDGWAAWTNSAHDYWKGDYFVGQRSIVPSDGRFRPVIETDFALEFIRRADARPFFLVLSWGPPHFPGTPPEEYLRDGPMPLRPNTPPERAERTANWTLPRYYGLIESLDAEFGRLMGELDALGLAEETIVVYASDHGAMMGSHGYMGKELPFSESAQVPWLLRWPGHVPAGSTPATPFGTTDILPTLAGLAGIAKPVGVDGVDLSGVLLGRPEATTQQAVYIAAHEPADLPAPGWRGVRTERHLFARTEAGPWLLYDVREDPYELRNLVDEAPPTLEALDALTLELMRRYGDTWST